MAVTQNGSHNRRFIIGVSYHESYERVSLAAGSFQLTAELSRVANSTKTLEVLKQTRATPEPETPNLPKRQSWPGKRKQKLQSSKL